jgi:CRISPR system Cascade subunit CasD
MSAETGYLALLLDAPLQSWGFASRFQRRTTGLHPTKSGVLGMICAAMGLGKGSEDEKRELPNLTKLTMTSIAIPRVGHASSLSTTGKQDTRPTLPVRRLEDFHTTGGGYDKKTQPQFIPRKASGGPCDNPTVSRRQYLADAKFGIILTGDRTLLDRIAVALGDPVWGIWFGRKSCLPAAPVCRGVFASQTDAEANLLESQPVEKFTRVEEVADFANGTDSYNDQPVSFGRTDSSSEGREFTVRRVNLIPGQGGG